MADETNKVPLSDIIGATQPQPIPPHRQQPIQPVPGSTMELGTPGGPPVMIETPGTAAPQPASQTEMRAAPQAVVTPMGGGYTSPMSQEEYRRLRLAEDNARRAEEHQKRSEYETMQAQQQQAYALMRIDIGKHVAATLATNDQKDHNAIAERALKIADALIASSGFRF